MTLSGLNFIGKERSGVGTETFEGINPAMGKTLGVHYHAATVGEIDQAVSLAASVSSAYRHVSPEAKAAFLERIGEEILALGDELLQQAHQETALPIARLTGERMRTVNQLRLFAALVREGSWVEARIDPALPDRTPLPRPDLRRMLIPIGPIAVFGASNFPFAFSVAGGDTASALAAGCPVVVKAHPAHPGASEMTAQAVLSAAEAIGMPNGVFSLLQGGADVGMGLVQHPQIEAVGFTGSLQAGRALFNAAASRPRPIPIYAEMGSVNPVFVLPDALAQRGETIATGLAQSVTLGVGQFCTNPGLVVGVASPDLTAFIQSVTDKISQAPAAPMLTPGLCRAYEQGTARLASAEGVQKASSAISAEKSGVALGVPTVFSVSATQFLSAPSLAEEVFGPSTLIVTCASPEELQTVAQKLEGQLTATVHGTPDDFGQFRETVSLLETKVGRLVFNGVPTGVEVSPAMQHGGPYPATTESRSTSVGTAAISRFARPVCWQDAPQEILPQELQNSNPHKYWRLVDNQWTQEAVNG